MQYKDILFDYLRFALRNVYYSLFSVFVRILYKFKIAFKMTKKFI